MAPKIPRVDFTIVFKTSKLNNLVNLRFFPRRVETLSLNQNKVDEMISSMKTVKMYCWENYFDELIKVARAAEMSKIWLSRCFQGILTSIFTSGSKQIIFASFLVLMQTTTVANFSGNDF